MCNLLQVEGAARRRIAKEKPILKASAMMVKVVLMALGDDENNVQQSASSTSVVDILSPFIQGGLDNNDGGQDDVNEQ